MTPARIDLAAGAAHLELLPALGAAIASFAWRDRPVLRPMTDEARAAANVRLAACYPLVPYSNRIRDATLRFGDTLHPLAHNFGDHPHAIHGVGWQRPWRAARVRRDAAVLTCEHAPEGDDARAWPWPFRATQAFDLAAGARSAALTLTLTLENTGAVPFPFGLGWHPFFPRDASTTLRFDADHAWLNDATSLPTERVPAAGPWSFAVARAPGAATIDNVFGGVRGGATIEADHHRTTIDADTACDRLVVYAPADGAFIAVEPVTHETDAFNRAAAGATATGMRVLRPGAAFSCTMRIGVSPLH